MPEDIVPIPTWARTLLYDALAQTDVDMDHHRLLNLDGSNLGLGVPTIHPPANQWLHDWDSTTQTWLSTRPNFIHLAGFLTLPQMQHINAVGTITEGVWQGTTLGASFVPRLDVIRLPGNSVNMNQQRLINLAQPINNDDAVTLEFVLAMVPGLHPKEICQCATVADDPLFGLRTIDGFAVGEGNRVLVKDQTVGTRDHLNGIWRAHAGAWTRATDSDTADELTLATTLVLNGTVNTGTTWVQRNQLTGIGPGNPVDWILFTKGAAGPAGPPGPGVPADGTAGQILKKNSGTAYDTSWFTPLYAPEAAGMPPGGDTGQILIKSADTDYDTEWITPTFPVEGSGLPPGGIADQILSKLSSDPFDADWIDAPFASTEAGQPTGGSTGQILTKQDSSDYHSLWVTPLFAPLGSQLPTGGAAGQILAKVSATDFDADWLTPTPDGAVYAILSTVRLSPAGTVNTSPGVMMGLGSVATITPLTSGKIVVTITGFINNNSTGGAITAIWAGIGTAPSNGAAPPGAGAAEIGSAVLRGGTGINVAVPFSLSALLSGRPIGTPIWFDLRLQAQSPGTAAMASVTVTAYELP